MPWTCQCSYTNGDQARFCNGCGQPFGGARPAEPTPPPPLDALTAAGPIRNEKVTDGIAPWKLGVVGGVLVLGLIFGTMVATIMFGPSSARATASTSPTQSVKSAFQSSFEASFKNSCRQSAMRSGGITQSQADSYCDCTLSVLNETHSMTKAVQTCAKRISRYRY